jgi:hypothetical protein
LSGYCALTTNDDSRAGRAAGSGEHPREDFGAVPELNGKTMRNMEGSTLRIRDAAGSSMVILINVGRFLMMAWVIYALLLILAPSVIHQAPNQTSGIIQGVIAFIIGNLLDRILGRLRRRRAEAAADNLASSPQASGDAGGVI